jgi:hypothetical protein
LWFVRDFFIKLHQVVVEWFKAKYDISLDLDLTDQSVCLRACT